MKNIKFRFFMPVEILMADEGQLDLSDEIGGDSAVIVTDPFLYESGQALTLGKSITAALIKGLWSVWREERRFRTGGCVSSLFPLRREQAARLRM